MISWLALHAPTHINTVRNMLILTWHWGCPAVMSLEIHFPTYWHGLHNTQPCTNVHIITEWLYLSSLLNSITFISFCSACPSPPFFLCWWLSVLLWDSMCTWIKGFLRADWRHFAQPPLSSTKHSFLTIRQLRRYTVLVSCGVYGCVCALLIACTATRHSQHFDSDELCLHSGSSSVLRSSTKPLK